jgi:hypothetical protein
LNGRLYPAVFGPTLKLDSLLCQLKFHPLSINPYLAVMIGMVRSIRLAGPSRWARGYATVSNPQTLIEKIVQKYAVDLPAGQKVRSGDYVMIQPEHV